jgi:hypothetical protein
MRKSGNIVAAIALVLVAMHVVLTAAGINPRIVVGTVAGATIVACMTLFIIRLANHRDEPPDYL